MWCNVEDNQFQTLTTNGHWRKIWIEVSFVKPHRLHLETTLQRRVLKCSFLGPYYVETFKPKKRFFVKPNAVSMEFTIVICFNIRVVFVRSLKGVLSPFDFIANIIAALDSLTNWCIWTILLHPSYFKWPSFFFLFVFCYFFSTYVYLKHK